MYRSLRLAPILCACLLQLPGVAQAAAPIETLTVQLRDLPAGAKLSYAHSISPKYAASISHVPLATFQREGLLGENLRAFTAGDPQHPTTLYVILFDFKQAAGAHAFFGTLLADRAKPTTVRGLGEENYDVRGTDTTHGNQPMPAETLMLRRAGYVIILAAEPLTASFSSATLAHLARTVDTRLAHAR